MCCIVDAFGFKRSCDISTSGMCIIFQASTLVFLIQRVGDSLKYINYRCHTHILCISVFNINLYECTVRRLLASQRLRMTHTHTKTFSYILPLYVCVCVWSFIDKQDNNKNLCLILVPFIKTTKFALYYYNKALLNVFVVILSHAYVCATHRATNNLEYILFVYFISCKLLLNVKFVVLFVINTHIFMYAHARVCGVSRGSLSKTLVFFICL